MNDEMYLTSEGAVKIKKELKTLRGAEREEIAKRLRSAVQMFHRRLLEDCLLPPALVDIGLSDS